MTYCALRDTICSIDLKRHEAIGMKVGKVSENILKRSVLKQIQHHREEVMIGAGIGTDCAFVACPESSYTVLTTDPVTYSRKNAGALAVYRVANDIAAAGAEPIGVLVTLLLAERDREARIKEIMGQIEETCASLHMQIIGGHTEVTDAVTRPIVTLTGVGKASRNALAEASGKKAALAGQDVVMTKYLGMEGTVVLAEEHEEELLTRLPKTLVDHAAALEQSLSVIPEAATAVKSNVSYMHDASEGGIFGALWEFAESAGVGLKIDLKSMPVKQETIEICEFFGLNPYNLLSGGSLLMAADNGYDLVKELENAGIKAAVIGKITDNNDRIIMNDGEERYLEMPQSDEIFKL